MKIEKANQITEYEMQNLRGTELYTELLKRKYLIECVDAEEAVAIWKEIGAHCSDLWHIQKTDSFGEDYYVYFSTDRDALIVMGCDEQTD